MEAQKEKIRCLAANIYAHTNMQNLFDQQPHEPRKRIKNAASSEEKETVDETQLLSLKVEKTKNDYNKYYGEL